MEAGNVFKIVITHRAQKAIDKYPQLHSAIEKALGILSVNPTSGPNIKRLRNYKYDYRYRIGDFRLLYDVYENEIKVEVMAFVPRGDAYK